MAQTIAFDFDMLHLHASRVEQIADDVAEAVSASRSTNMAGGAFGVMCGFLVPPALAVTEAAKLFLCEAEGLLNRTSRELRAIAADMEQTECDIIDRVRTLESELG